jgi:hypothetical protein
MAIAFTVLSACTARASDTSFEHPNISATPTVEPVRPRAVNANAFTTRTPIKHVVFVVKENRTFDNLFGTFPRANGVTVGMDMGSRRPLIRGTDGRLPSDIPHCYRCAIQAWDNGKMDGFDQPLTGKWAYSQLRRGQIPNYWHWAERNVLFDDFFSSAWGPSFPNHLYTIAAQSKETRDNPRRPDRGRPAQPSARPLGLLRRHRATARLHLVRVLRDRPVPERSEEVGDVHPPRRLAARRHRRQHAPAGDVGHAALRAVRSPGLFALPW